MAAISNTSQMNPGSGFVASAFSWLNWQCSMVSGVKLGVVYLLDDSAEALTEVACWPSQEVSELTEQLEKISLNACHSGSRTEQKLTHVDSSSSAVYDTFSFPLICCDKTLGVVSLVMATRGDEQKKAVYQILQWGVIWLQSLLEQSVNEKSKFDPLVNQLIHYSASDKSFDLVVHQICQLLAERLACERVSFAVVSGFQVVIKGFSDQLRFSRVSHGVSSLEAVIEEAVEQGVSLNYPAQEEGETFIVQKHHLYSKENGAVCLLTIPLFVGNNIFGAISLQRPRGQVFASHEVNVLNSIVDVLGPTLKIKLRDEEFWLKKLNRKVALNMKKLLGPEDLAKKVTLFTVLFMILSLGFIQKTDVIHAKSTIEGCVQQMIIAPRDGFVESAHARAGDLVEKNQIMARLDSQNLLLEYEKLFSELKKISKEYQEALANRERSKVSILKAKIEQAEAEMDLVNLKMERSNLRAPFNGMVVSGDLNQSIGVPVEQGQRLFQVASVDDFRLALQVSEDEIFKIKIGQTGRLRLVSFPYEYIPITINRITPIAKPEKGGNYFRVEASIDDKSIALRPGMEGIANVDGGTGSILWVWSSALFSHIRLWLWSIGL